MTTTDPIADYLTRLRNAMRARHKRVDIPASRLKKQITQLLAQQKFVTGFTSIDDNKQGIIRITLRYTDGRAVIQGLRRISRPGIRRYVPSDKLPRVMNGMGIAVISTSKGVMTDKQARLANLGGEVICEVW